MNKRSPLNWIKKTGPFLLLLFLAGCLTSTNPFYEQGDIIQDARFVGTFMNLKGGVTDLAATIVADKNGSYVLHLSEGGQTTDYQAVLFKIKDSTFVDLLPLDEPKGAQKFQEGVETASGFLEAFSHDSDDDHLSPSKRLHVILRLSLLEKGMVCFFSKEQGPDPEPSDALLKSGLKLRGENPVIEEPAPVLRTFLAKYAGTNWPDLFENPDVNQDSYYVLTRVQKGVIPPALVGVWSTNKVIFKDAEISAGFALCINTYGVAGIAGDPSPSEWHGEIRSKMTAAYNATNHILTLTKEPEATLETTNVITDTFVYDPQAKTLTPKNGVIKDVLKRQKSSVPYGVIESLD